MTTIRICSSCNKSFSPDEEYMAAFLGTMLYGSDADYARLEAILESNWNIQNDLDGRLAVEHRGGITRVSLEPDEARMCRVIEKNAIGHLHLEDIELSGMRPSQISVCALKNLPNDTRDMLFGVTPEWRIVQDGAYRYRASLHGAIFVRSVIHEYLATEAVWQVSA